MVSRCGRFETLKTDDRAWKCFMVDPINLAVSECDSPACQIIWTQFHQDLVSNKNLDEVLSDLSTNGSEDRFLRLWGIVDGTSEHSIRETFQNHSVNLNHIIFGLLNPLLLSFRLVSLSSGLFLSKEGAGGNLGGLIHSLSKNSWWWTICCEAFDEGAPADSENQKEDIQDLWNHFAKGSDIVLF